MKAVLAPAGGVGVLVLSGAAGAAALLAAALITSSLLPAFAVGSGLILLISFAFRADDLLRLVPLGIALTPAVALIGSRAADEFGALLVLGFMTLMVIAALRIPLVAVFGISETAVVIFGFGLLVGLTHGEGVGEASVIARSLLPFFLAWIVGRLVARVSGSGHALWWTAVLFLAINAPVGILEGLTATDLVVFPQTGLVEIGETGFARPNGFLSTDIDFALSMTLCVAVLVGGPGEDRVWAIPVAMLGSVAVVLASFRTGWIVLGIIWFAWLIGRGARTWLLAGAVLLVAIPLLVQPVQELAGSEYVQERVINQSNVFARAVSFEQAWQLFVDDPIIGVGLNGFQVDPLVLAAPGVVVTPHNLWLGVLAETGVAGAIGLLLFAVTTTTNCLRLARRRLTRSTAARGVIWACIVVLPFSLTFQILFVPMSILLVGLIAGTARGIVLADEGRA